MNEIAERIANIVSNVTDEPPVGIAYEPMRIGETPTNVGATGLGWDRLSWDPSKTDWEGALRDTVLWYRGKPYNGEVVAGW